jgi:hypothetical protein
MNQPQGAPGAAPAARPAPRSLLRQLGDLSGRDWWALLETVALMPLFVVGVRALGANRVARAVAGKPLRPTASRADAQLSRARALARLTTAVDNRLPWQETCLPASLCLCWLLRRRGIDCDLLIGVRPGGGPLSAHAWVEHAGTILNDSEDVRRRFAAFPPIRLPRGRP